MHLLISFLALNLLANPGEKVIRGWLGVDAENLDTAMKVALKVNYGVIVMDVVENSPAQKGGIELGDVMLEIEGEKIFERDDMEYVIKRRPNKKVEIVILRKGDKKKLLIELGSKEYDEYVIKLPPFRFPEDLERAIKNLRPRWEEEMDALRRDIEELKQEIEKLKKAVEKEGKI